MTDQVKADIVRRGLMDLEVCPYCKEEVPKIQLTLTKICSKCVDKVITEAYEEANNHSNN
jgi:ribosomal protein L37AE/L43A